MDTSQLVNGDELDLGSTLSTVLKNYNAKPFLTGPKYHNFHEGKGYLEVDVDIHRFCYLARKVSVGFMDHLPKMVLSCFSFLVHILHKFLCLSGCGKKITKLVQYPEPPEDPHPTYLHF